MDFGQWDHMDYSTYKEKDKDNDEQEAGKDKEKEKENSDNAQQEGEKDKENREFDEKDKENSESDEEDSSEMGRLNQVRERSRVQADEIWNQILGDERSEEEKEKEGEPCEEEKDKAGETSEEEKEKEAETSKEEKEKEAESSEEEKDKEAETSEEEKEKEAESSEEEKEKEAETSEEEKEKEAESSEKEKENSGEMEAEGDDEPPRGNHSEGTPTTPPRGRTKAMAARITPPELAKICRKRKAVNPPRWITPTMVEAGKTVEEEPEKGEEIAVEAEEKNNEKFIEESVGEEPTGESVEEETGEGVEEYTEEEKQSWVMVVYKACEERTYETKEAGRPPGILHRCKEKTMMYGKPGRSVADAAPKKRGRPKKSNIAPHASTRKGKRKCEPSRWVQTPFTAGKKRKTKA